MTPCRLKQADKYSHADIHLVLLYQDISTIRLRCLNTFILKVAGGYWPFSCGNGRNTARWGTCWANVCLSHSEAVSAAESWRQVLARSGRQREDTAYSFHPGLVTQNKPGRLTKLKQGVVHVVWKVVHVTFCLHLTGSVELMPWSRHVSFVKAFFFETVRKLIIFGGKVYPPYLQISFFIFQILQYRNFNEFVLLYFSLTWDPMRGRMPKHWLLTSTVVKFNFATNIFCRVLVEIPMKAFFLNFDLEQSYWKFKLYIAVNRQIFQLSIFCNFPTGWVSKRYAFYI